jgi:hypothetical protein
VAFVFKRILDMTIYNQASFLSAHRIRTLTELNFKKKLCELPTGAAISLSEILLAGLRQSLAG